MIQPDQPGQEGKGAGDRRLSRRSLLAAAGVGAAGAAVTALKTRSFNKDRPNIVVLLADDLGYGDLSCQGRPPVATPNIDAIAERGVRFTDGYACSPVCSPSRAGLLTGRYPQRYGHEFNTNFTRRPERGLDVRERTLADHLKAAGYRTGLVGKWHLGTSAPFHPLQRGFDEFWGFLGGSHPYAPFTRNNAKLYSGTQVIREDQFLTEAMTREATGFIRRCRREPFFLYVAYNAVHPPFRAPDEYLWQVADVAGTHRLFAAVLYGLDRSVARICETLRRCGIEENTLVMFQSDNGGRRTVSDNGLFAGGKQSVNEGGIRIPWLAQWPAAMRAGRVYSQPAIACDVAATALAAATATAPADRPLDGVDLVPSINGAEPPRRDLFWRFGSASAIRRGRWKLVRLDGRRALFDLVSDPNESIDRAHEQGSLVNELEAAYRRWNAQMIRPRWQLDPRRRGDAHGTTLPTAQDDDEDE